MEPKLAILVVEDDALIAENLRLTLQDLGYATPPACHTYARAEAALTRPGGVAADLVLLDINLGSADPARTGLALARHLSGPAAPPFVFLTAYADLDTIRHATRLQPSGYLIKPVTPPRSSPPSRRPWSATTPTRPPPCPPRPKTCRYRTSFS